MKKGKVKASDQSNQMYALTGRRPLETTGGGCAHVNSRDLSTVIPHEHLPKEICDVKYTKKGVKITERPVNAERMFTQQGRRHQMRLGAHMDSGNRKEDGRQGKYPQGAGIMVPTRSKDYFNS